MQAEHGLIVVAAYARGTQPVFYKVVLTILDMSEDALLAEAGCSLHLPHGWVASSSISGALIDTHFCSLVCIVCRFTHACVCCNKERGVCRGVLAWFLCLPVPSGRRTRHIAAPCRARALTTHHQHGDVPRKASAIQQARVARISNDRPYSRELSLFYYHAVQLQTNDVVDARNRSK